MCNTNVGVYWCHLGLLCVLLACSPKDGEPAVSSSDTFRDSVGDRTEPISLCTLRPDICSVPIGDEPSYTEPVYVVPGDGLPGDLSVDIANNNLDVTFWRGRLWLAFRTGPYHFADESVRMYVVSSDDLKVWRYEGDIALGTDVREPQLVVLDDELLWYYAELGVNALAFQPQGTWLRRYRSVGVWSEPVKVFAESFIPWRVRSDGQVLQVFGYTGGENIYARDGDPIEVHWLQSSDGENFEAVIPGQPVVLSGGSSETDAVITPAGKLIGVSRNEAGDTEGFGMKICRADKDSLGAWTCIADKKKYDSPNVFTFDDRVFLIGRRNVTDTGNYDLEQTQLPVEQQYTINQLDYSDKPKRCALWSIDETSLAVTFVLDLPSAGDTCFAEVLDLGAGRFLVFNYTSPLGQENDPTWSEGQFGPTLIYYTVLTIPTSR